MAQNLTFTMIKPCAVRNRHTGSILKMILERGFRIKAMKLTRMTRANAEAFYGIHAGKPFFEELVNFMSSGPIVAAILEKENAIDDFRELIGSTNPANAAPGTIRQLFAESFTANAIHGSDSDENALIEGAFFFSATEQF
jgi:nucleoside-diphosphate kinase